MTAVNMACVISEPEDDHFASFYPYSWDTSVLSCQPVLLMEATGGPLFKSQPVGKLF